ncbi:MAG TPA: coagulation factor 5/8 type domain-containing protein [Candidatus Angelobacter sp.]|nr:coagulation factor 5/8 type domain-containing protein [Candidatus Angelobacter sp.]
MKKILQSTPWGFVRPGAVVRLALILGLVAYYTTTASAAAPIGKTISLQANNNSQFVSADQNLGANAPLTASRTAVAAWEQFQVIDAGGGLIALQSVGTGHFVSADQNLGSNAPLVADRTAVAAWEQFRWIDLGNGQINLQSVGTGKFVSADLNLGSNAPLVANRTTASLWETFTWAVIGGGTSAPPNFGPNVLIFNPSQTAASIQSQINNVFSTQQNNQFGSQRNALLFQPGQYNVDIPVGFYTQVLGLGGSPDAVRIAGNVHADPTLSNNNATQTFWRAAEGFSVSPSTGTLQWAVSQAAPFRRMHVLGNMVLHQNNGFGSGGWMSDDLIDGNVDSGPQQQWIARNTQWASWTGANWNMVFVGDVNPPAGSWPNPDYTELAQVPIIREKPFLQIDAAGNYSVVVPSLRANSSGITWSAGSTPGTTIPISQFYIARSDVDTAATINAQLAAGKNLLLTPGVYSLTDTIRVTQANTVVLGLGFATLLANNGVAAMSVADVDGVILAGLLFDAGVTNAPVLLEVGPSGSSASHATNPISLHDVFFRVGGAAVGNASVNLRINSNDTIVDHTWIWRADHGTGVGWTSNTSANGLVVNGNNVTIYGLFVEHFQQFQVLWNGNGGHVYFYQSEIPYDPPNQASFTSASGTNGWASYKVADNVTSHEAWGLGVYSFFHTSGIFLGRSIEVPNSPNVKFHDMITVCLGGNGGITNVINNAGGSTSPNVSVTPKVTNFP